MKQKTVELISSLESELGSIRDVLASSSFIEPASVQRVLDMGEKLSEVAAARSRGILSKLSSKGRKLVLRNGPYGRYYGCSNYSKGCRYVPKNKKPAGGR